MNNDLISRSALLKRIDEEREYLKARGQFGAEHILVHNFRDLIDNAPTVNFMISPDYVTELQNRNKELIKQLEEAERPQGEWIDHSETDGYVECPFCGSATTCEDNKDELHFCFSCGADMRGEKE